ncbi:MAG: prepilin-type N-terminal cleavage/methylation domain-containing protein [Planctomycetota bacterium]|nr:prepilin-type N-terminal cleavage/methylation domain-containing protein [Planctomycetota bacterium]
MRVPSGQSADCNSLQLKRPRHAGFTLIELLVAIAIISLLSAALLIALTELQAQSKLRRCQQQIKKIDQLIIQRWDEILHKPLPIQLSPLGATPTGQEIQARKLQVLIARRELLRLEMPERITDISDNPVVFPGGYVMPLPATTSTFRRKAVFNASQGNVWTEQYQGAECLYLILSVMQDQDSSALDFFFPGEIGDIDNDGMPEILDGFNQPIGFLRWAPGISSRVGLDYRWGTAGTDEDQNQSMDDGSEAGHGDDYRSFSDIQKVSAAESPDATDMGAADYRLYDNNASNDPYNLFPLIMSAGRDGTFGTYGFGANPGVSGFSYKSTVDSTGMPPSALEKATGSTNAFPYDPYISHADSNSDGFPYTYGAFVHDGMIDNISNHQIEVNP